MSSAKGKPADNGEEKEDIFLHDLPEDLKCPICLCCLKDPYQTPCGHRFCKDCILPIINSRNNVCPNDRHVIDLTNTYPDNAVKLQINRLEIRCPMEGCEWKGELSDKKTHLYKCTFTAVRCELCGVPIPKTQLSEHTKECPQRKVNCKYCQKEVSHAELESHQNNCPQFPMFCQFGCSNSEQFTRETISAHYNECPRVLMACTMIGCSQQVERAQLQEHLVHCVPRQGPAMTAVILNLQKQVAELKITVAKQNMIINAMDTVLYPCDGQFTWRIDSIREKIKAAQAGDQASVVIYSPYFFSCEAGYKLSLCIYPAGDNNQGFLSLYFVVMKGRYDEILQWPFQKRVFLSLLNTKSGGGVTKDIQPDPRLHYFFRPEGPRNVGYGYPKFIALPRLLQSDSEYVANEAIFLRCRVFT